jgi:CubicO group peptidase (beta-lactamase class C family)
MAGTFFWIDPAEDMFAVFMMQGPGQREYIRSLLRNLVYATVECGGRHNHHVMPRESGASSMP